MPFRHPETRRRWAAVILTIPATVLWLPICLHLGVIFFLMAAVPVSRGLPAGISPAVPVGGVVAMLLCVGGVAGLASLWVLLIGGSRLTSLAGLRRMLLVSALCVGVLSALVALGFGSIAVWKGEADPVLLLVLATLLGPLSAVCLVWPGFLPGSDPGTN